MVRPGSRQCRGWQGGSDVSCRIEFGVRAPVGRLHVLAVRVLMDAEHGLRRRRGRWWRWRHRTEAGFRAARRRGTHIHRPSLPDPMRAVRTGQRSDCNVHLGRVHAAGGSAAGPAANRPALGSQCGVRGATHSEPRGRRARARAATGRLAQASAKKAPRLPSSAEATTSLKSASSRSYDCLPGRRGQFAPSKRRSRRFATAPNWRPPTKA
jgi:hypothetical protein